jgi:iron complex outermembrane receptor protein
LRLVGATLFGSGLILTTSKAVSETESSPISSPPSRVEDLRDLSIEELGNIRVTSVSKSAQPLRDAPAAIYVITHEDIVRSGATRLPEILRLAPNLQVFQTSATSWVVTARGFSGDSTAQSFSDKLLVLIDGRSVYSPLFSGVYWDTQDVPPEDIDRIEVISGPGAALWGANAVNGVINVITRRARDTQGGVIEAGIGNQERGVGIQYGGRIGDDLAYRLYVRDYRYDDTVTASGARANDGGSKPQGGGRLDWTPTASDLITVQGDSYRGAHAQQGAPNEDVSGGDVLGRWTHTWATGASLQAQAYWDHAARATEEGEGAFAVDTYDVDIQAAFALGAINRIVVGGGYRESRYDIAGPPTLYFVPAIGRLPLPNAFVQDTLALPASISLVGGLKLEDDPYSGLSPLPSLRLSWTPSDRLMTWAAVSRAVRAPTPFDTDVVEKIGQITYLTGSPNFQTEKVTAYEVGARAAPAARASASLSVFYNVYDDVRTVEPAPVGFIPLTWGNGLRGESWGLEAWSQYELATWWRLTATFDLLREHFTFKPGASGLLGVSQIGDDPPQQASLRSSFTLARRLSLDADLRYVDALPDPFVPAYVELNSRIAWDVSRRLQLSVSGFNLLHSHHQEFPAPAANAVPRAVYAAMRLRF